MNNTERHNRTSRESETIRKSLFDTIKDFFQRTSPDKAGLVDDYLEKPPEKVTNGKVDVSQKQKRQAQQTRLTDLKETLEMTSASIQADVTEVIVEQAKGAASEMANQSNAMVFQVEFYKKMASISIDGQFALPYARYVAQSMETASSSDLVASAKQKTELALEIFVAETGETTNAIPILKKIVQSVIVSHQGSDVQRYFTSQEFKDLCLSYGLSEEQIENLIKKGPEREEALSIETEPEMNLEKAKNELLSNYDDIENRVSLDLELLSLSSEKILTLLKTVDQDEAEAGYRHRDRERLESLNQPDQKERLFKDRTVNGWIDDYINEHHLVGAQAEQLRNRVMGYYLKFRNRVYLEKMRRYSRAQEMYRTRDPYHRWVDELNDNIIAADLMLSSYDAFLYNEYFKGQTAAAIIEGDKLKVAIQAAKNEERFTIPDHMIYQDIMRDLQQGYLAEMSQETNRNYSAMKQQISEAIQKMKMEPEVKEEITYGGVYTRRPSADGKRPRDFSRRGMDIIFVYSRYFEDVAEGGEFTEQGFFADPTLAHMTAVFPIAMNELKEAYQTLGEIVKIAESKGDAEGLSEAAGKVTSALIDVVAEHAPIAVVAMQSYLRLIRQKLAANGGIITPDMFGSTSYVKGEFSKLLEMEVKNAHQITDFEKDVYLKMGMGLAFASGEMQATLANCRPPMSLSIEKLPPSIQAKIERGETLTLAEMKALEGNFGPTFRDFSFRGLLMNLNPLLWLHTWIKFNDYGVFHLGFTPYKTGENAIDPGTNYDATQQIMFSTFLGLSEEAVQYFDGSYRIPVLELSRMNQKMSVEKRGGVREKVKQLLARDFVVERGPNGLMQVDGDRSFARLMEASPLLAYSLLTDGSIADHVKAYWQVGENKVETSKLPPEFKEAKIKDLLDYMHLYYPTFFTSIEQPMYFRRRELSFLGQIRENILRDLRAHPERDDGYWLLLSKDEADVAISKSADIHPLGDKHMHEGIIGTKRVNERMTIMMMELQTYLQEKGDRSLVPRKNIRDFVLADNPAEYDPGMWTSLNIAINNIINTYNLQPKHRDQIRQLFIRYSQEVFYGQRNEKKEQNNSSLYSRCRYLGNKKLSAADSQRIRELRLGTAIPQDIIDNNGASLSDYYARLIKEGVIVEPFDWAYFDRTQLNYQATGLKMTGRNIGDYSHGYMAYSSKYMDAMGALQDAISQPKESKKIIQAGLDKFEGTINGIATGYSGKEAGEAGWLAMAFLTYPFIPSRWKDIPLAGKLPVIHSWATLFNHDDRAHLNAWDARGRKEMMDHVLKKPWSKMMLHYLQDNKKLDDLRANFFERRDENGEVVSRIPMPKFIRSIFGRKFKNIYDEGRDDFSIKSMKSFLKVEDWWVGGKDNLGIGYNTLMSILMIGFFMLMLQAMKEGMKEAEIK